MSRRSVPELERELRELESHKDIERIKVSQACSELVQYCQTKQGEDNLVTKELKGPFASKKKSCVIQ